MLPRLCVTAWRCCLLTATLAACTTPGQSPAQTPAMPMPTRGTDAVPNDPDDPAIWIDSQHPERSLVIGTDKIEASGGLYVFGLDGEQKQTFRPLDRPNNVDVEYGVAFGARHVDVAVVTERNQHRLRVFSVDHEGLRDLTPAGLPVLAGETGEASEPMGIALFKRPRDGAVFVIVAPKTGPAANYLWQYRLDGDAAGHPQVTFVRRFGAFSRAGAAPGEIGEVEAVVVDDDLGYVYYSDERFGIRKYHADPDLPEARVELGVLGSSGYQGDREGLAIYRTGPLSGWLISADQIPGATRLHIFPREGAGADPHAQAEIAMISTTADETDGLEVTSVALPGFDAGTLIMMNSSPRNFLLYDWHRIAAQLVRR